MRPIYLDNNATTRVDPEVLAAMLPYFAEEYGNAGSKTHAFGWRAKEAVDRARQQVAHLIGSRVGEIVFTSGATEANNLAIFGVAHSVTSGSKRHIVTCTVEHKAVLDPCQHLEKHGFRVTYLKPDSTGRVTAEQVADAITDDTALITLMAANNELGTLHPLAEIGAIARERGVLLHTDAAQAIGKHPVDVQELGVHLLTTSAHKFYGPKGAGFLYVRSRDPKVQLASVLHGGGQELGLRPGTLSVPHIVGLGEACEMAGAHLEDERARLRQLSVDLLVSLKEEIPGLRLNSHPEYRLAGTLNVTIPGVESEALLLALPDVALSSGSACTSTVVEPSYVLRGIGLDAAAAHGSIRIGIGRFNTAEEVAQARERLVAEVRRLRKIR